MTRPNMLLDWIILLKKSPSITKYQINVIMEKNLTQLAVTIFGHYHLRLRLKICDKIKEKRIYNKRK